jgi:TatD DNase family protein
VPRNERIGADGGSESPLLTDTHVHLNLKAYNKDRREVIARALNAGVGFMVNVGFDLKTSRESVDLARQHGFIRASVGLHPHGASDMDDELLSTLEGLASEEVVVAVGETGLDYFRDLSPREDQRQAFRLQIRLARKLGLPLIIHNRDALEDVLAIMDDEGASDVGGVMHCFPGDESYAAEVVERGFHVGIGGPVTYSGKRLPSVAAAVPLNRLLLETDAPWLTPEPHRRGRNEPSYVPLIAERIADIRGMSVEDLARATSGNSTRLFGFPEVVEPSIAYKMWGNLYLNITNQCTNSCSFCIRNFTDTLWGYNLKLRTEPTAELLLAEIGDPGRYREIVFCGYGEPTVRLDVILEVGKTLRSRGARVRLDTNGQGNLIWNRNIAPELADAVDAVSVSLNAQDAGTYDRICHSRFGDKAYEHVLSFTRECVKVGLDVSVSVVDVPEIDIEAARRVADDLGVSLRVRG